MPGDSVRLAVVAQPDMASAQDAKRKIGFAVGDHIDLSVMLKDGPALAKAQKLSATVDGMLRDKNINVDLNDTRAMAKLAALRTTLMKTLNSKANIEIRTATAEQALASYTADADAARRKTEDLTGAVKKSASYFSLWGMAANAGAKQIPLFNAAVGKTYSALRGGDAELPKLVNHLFSMTNGWHLATEAVVEFTAIWAPAIIAAGAFAAAAVPGAKAVYQQYQNVNTVLDATGKSINGMDNSMSGFNKAAIPALTSLEGAFVNISNSAGNSMAPAIREVGTVIQKFATQITGAMSNSGGGFAKFVQSGAHDISLLGDSFTQLGRIVSLLFKDVPGYAEKLILVGNAALRVTGNVISAINPLIKYGMAVHGAFFYLGLAGTLAAKFGTILGGAVSGGVMKAGLGVEKLGTKLGSMGGFLEKAGGKLGNLAGTIEGMPWGMIVMGAAAAGIGIYLLYEKFKNAGDEASKMGDQFNSAFAKITSAAQGNALVISQVGKVYSAYQADVKNLANVNRTASQSFQGVHDGVDQAAVSQAKYSGQMQKQTQNLANAMQRQNQLNLVMQQGIKTTGSAAAFQQLWTDAGLKTSQMATDQGKAWHQDMVAVMNYTAGLAANMQQSKATGNSVAALTIAGSAQVQAVQQLNSAWQSFITTATGADDAYTKFEGSVSTMKSSLDSGGKATLKLGNMSQKLAVDAGTLAHAFNRTDSSSIQLRQSWDSLIGQGSSVIQSLATQSATAGNTARSQKLLAQGGALVVAQLAPMAKGSKVATAELYALAQQAGYTGKDSLASISKWAKKAAGDGTTLNGVIGNMTVQMADANKDAQKLIGSLMQLANEAFTQAIYKNSQMNSQVNSFADALVHADHQVTPAVTSVGEKLYGAMIKAGMGTDSSKSAIDGWMRAMGFTQPKIAAMNKQLDAYHAKQVNNKVATDALTASIKNLPAKKGVVITEKISGGGKVTIQGGVVAGGNYGAQGKNGQVATNAHGGQSFNGYSYAAGGTVPGASPNGKDNHLAMVKSGELIIPSQHAPKFADMARKASIPGFASGGMIGQKLDNVNDNLIPQTQGTVNKVVQSATQAWVTATMKQMQAAAASASMSMAGVANSSALAALKSAAAKMGWTGNQWQALYNVEMREAGFNLSAKNPSSGAYGLAQFINGPSEYAQYGGNLSAAGQATAMVNYIKSRYGSPSAAWAHETSAGWYENGTRSAAKGMALVGERGPELVSFGGGERVYNAQQTRNFANNSPYSYAASAVPRTYSQQTGADPITQQQNHQIIKLLSDQNRLIQGQAGNFSRALNGTVTRGMYR